MQYILSKEEIENLVPLSKLKVRDEALEVARIKILELANYTCIYDRDNQMDTYCTGCPLAAFTKNGSEPLHKMICKQHQAYGK